LPFNHLKRGHHCRSTIYTNAPDSQPVASDGKVEKY
jgi:hypothetical protein